MDLMQTLDETQHVYSFDCSSILEYFYQNNILIEDFETVDNTNNIEK